jgi:medium-chain acyl-[acyl-carrier-protein] hydrolase
MGAVISFELARYLRSAYGTAPLHLFVSGCHGPQVKRKHLALHTLPKDRFLDELGRLNGTPTEVLNNAEIMRMMMSYLRADFEMVETYVYSPQPPLDCPITTFGGEQDNVVSLDELVAWREHTGGGWSLQMFPGDHFFLRSARHLILKRLALALEPFIRSTNDAGHIWIS